MEKTILDSLQALRLSPDDSINIFYKYVYSSGKYDFMSSAIKDLTGYSADELNEMGFQSIVKELHKKQRDTKSIDKTQMIEDYYAKYIIETKDKVLKWVEDISFINSDKSGTKLYSVGVLRDVTPLHEFVNKLNEEKLELESILNLSEAVFLVTDKDLKIRMINEKAAKVLGRKKKNILGSFLIDIVDTGYKGIFTKRMEEYMKGFESFTQEIEIPLYSKTKNKILVNFHFNLIKDQTGETLLVVFSGEDITEKKKQEKIQSSILAIHEAANSEKDLVGLFKFIHECIKELMPAENFFIALYDSKDKTISFPYFIDAMDKEPPVKKGAKGLTGYVLRTGKSALVNKEMDSLLQQKGEVEMVGTPTEIWLGVPLKIQDNTIGVLVVQDYKDEKTYGNQEKEILELVSYPISRVIERKRVEVERDELIKKLRELNESKDKLFSLISHDLRSPFNSLLGFSEILTSEYDSLTDDEIREYINVISETSKNLYGMTNNLLAFSRFQMEKLVFNPVKLNLKKIISSNVNMLKGNIIKKNLNLTIEVDNDIYVVTDEEMLNSIFQNLISNAVKFTNRGGEINISAKLIKFFEEPDNIEVRIEDTGVGMSKSIMEKVFKSHIQSTPGTEREYGTGLGLLLVKEFIVKNGGNIKVQSKLGQGTTFIFTLPLYSKKI
jgi:PAS domain S-box-containing protein